MGDSGDWVPFGLDANDAEQHRVLVDGVPSWLLEPLIAWLRPRLADDKKGFSVRSKVTRDIELLTRIPKLGLPDVYSQWLDYERNHLRPLNEQQLLMVVDAVLSMMYKNGSESVTRPLDEILLVGRSKWHVGEGLGKPGLVARVPEGVQDMVEHTITTSGTAGQLLGRAWGKVYGLVQDDSGAYTDSVKAVETAA